ncbi:ribonuclease P protein component [Deltaproteobacteria bacterium OttesenSCG-928-K17]|nr:ribonuclease P protein component [Deltaproteobacteria bacterium OttesenSCG-928-K17]
MYSKSDKDGGFSFPKAARLLKRSQFLAISHPSVRPDFTIKAGSFLVVGKNNTGRNSRLGVTVTKKVGSAVTRNRLKRQVREFFRHNRRFWPVGFDLVIIARHGAAHKSGAELAADLKRAGQKLEAMAAEGGRNDTPPKNGGDSPEARGGAIRPITGGDA